MPVIPTIRLLFVIWTNAPFLLHYYRALERYYNFIFAGRKISREKNFAGGKFREIPFAVDFIFAGGKFRAKSKFANIAKISSTRKIGVIQYTLGASSSHGPVVYGHHSHASLIPVEYQNSWNAVLRHRYIYRNFPLAPPNLGATSLPSSQTIICHHKAHVFRERL